MNITPSSWVKSPTVIGGLDQLAVQAPASDSTVKFPLVSQTSPIHYYSIYPWVVWSTEKGLRYGDTFIDLFRRLHTNDAAQQTYDLHLALVN